MNKRLLAFTLIELLVVIAIIGILSSLIVVSMSGVTDKATIAKSQVFSNSLRNSLMLNLVSEWKFDGNTNDTWGTNNGTVSSSPVVTPNCVSGSCYYFDGVDDYISIPDSSSLDITDAITLEAWVNIASLQNTNYEYIIRKTAAEPNQGTLYGLLMGYSNAGARFFLWTENNAGCVNAVDSVGSLALNKWYHLVATYDYISHVSRIYINGVLDNTNSANATGKIRVNANTLYLSNRVDGTLYFNGLMDGVRIYSAAMPSFQIKEQYYAGLNNLLISGSINKNEYIERTRELTMAQN